MDALSGRIVAHHVGARGYRVSFNVPERFRNEVLHVLYDADRDCIERMRQGSDAAHSAELGETRVYPFCVGRSRRSARLNITANAYASSLFEPNPEFFGYYSQIDIGPASYDVSFRDMLEVVRSAEVEVRSIDELIADGSIAADARPDFLSVDTQGYEIEILEGARDAIAGGVLGVVCEVEMLPMYRGQPLFGDVLAHMQRSGFIYAGYTSYYEASPLRAPVGLRGNALPGFGDALFLRDPRSLAQAGLAAGRQYLMLLKLAFMAVNFAQIEYALLAMQQAKSLRAQLPPELLSGLRRWSYIRFLEELQEAVDRHEQAFLPVHAVPDESRTAGDERTSWYDKHHASAARRVALRAVGPGRREAIVRFLFGSSLARSARRLVPKRLELAIRSVLLPESLPPPAKTVAPAAPQSGAPDAKQETGASREEPPPPPRPPGANYTRFELILYGAGFTSVMDVVRRKRLAAQRYLRALTPEMVRDAGQAHLQR